MKNKLILIILTIALGCIFTSCKKVSEDNLEGSWRVTYMKATNPQTGQTSERAAGVGDNTIFEFYQNGTCQVSGYREYYHINGRKLYILDDDEFDMDDVIFGGTVSKLTSNSMRYDIDYIRGVSMECTMEFERVM